MGSVDFSLPGPLLAALIASLFQPAFLWLVTKIPSLEGRNPIQFAISTAIVFVVWLAALVAIPGLAPSSPEALLVGAFAIGGALLLYLEIWGLMSRGYTLSILIALADAGRPLSPPEIARAYRGGEGLDWIVSHRLGGMQAAGAIELQGERVTLTASRGVPIARLYRLCIAILGLRKTG